LIGLERKVQDSSGSPARPVESEQPGAQINLASINSGAFKVTITNLNI